MPDAKQKFRIVHAGAIAFAWVLALLTINLLNYYAPRVEGWLYPVAGATQVEVVNLGSGQVSVSGVMAKTRACELLSTVAYVSNDAGLRVQAKIAPTKNIILRDTGAGQQWGPWIIEVPVWYAKANLEVVTTHQCHPFWATRSKFFRVKLP